MFGLFFRSRYHRDGKLDDLNQAIEYSLEAVNMTRREAESGRMSQYSR